MKKFSAIAATGFVLMALTTIVAAQRVGGVLTIDEPQSSDQYVAGRIVRVSAPIEGDLVAGGQRVIVEGDIRGDLIAAGETLELRSPIADDARVAARSVIVTTQVAGHLVAAGDQVELGSAALVGDWAGIAGRSVIIDGQIGGELRAFGEQITVSGRIGDDAVLTGEQIRIEPNAVIGGNLIVQSEAEPQIAAGATVQGEVIREGLPRGLAGAERFDFLGSAAGALFIIVATLCGVLALFALFPGFSGSGAGLLRAGPLPTLGIGLCALFLPPLLIAVLFITGIGFLAGIALLGTYLLSLLFGMWFGIIVVSLLALELSKPDQQGRLAVRFIAVAVGTIVVLLLAQIPLLGTILAAAVWLAGLGSLIIGTWRAYRQPSAA